jgi:hypothetical protein
MLNRPGRKEGMGTSNRTLKQKAYHEFKEMLVITIYLWVVFELLAIHKSVILAENHINIVSQSFAFLSALALAKSCFLPGGSILRSSPTNRPLSTRLS